MSDWIIKIDGELWEGAEFTHQDMQGCVIQGPSVKVNFLKGFPHITFHRHINGPALLSTCCVGSAHQNEAFYGSKPGYVDSNQLVLSTAEVRYTLHPTVLNGFDFDVQLDDARYSALSEMLALDSQTSTRQSFGDDVAHELERARTKFPENSVLLAALVEEVGELAKAITEESLERVWDEAVQVAVVAQRIAEEGCREHVVYRREKNL